MRALLVAALAVSLGLAARMNEGYVLIVVPPYRIELSLALFVILFVASFALVYSVLRLLVHTVRLPAYVDQFRRRQREARGHAAMQDAWQSYLEGRFGQAQVRDAREQDRKCYLKLQPRQRRAHAELQARAERGVGRANCDEREILSFQSSLVGKNGELQLAS